MSDSGKQRNDGDERPPQAPESEPKPAADTEAIGLSIEERGMVVMPQVSVPLDQIDIGNMPRADASPADSEHSGGESGSGSGDAAAGEGAGE